jgi:threonine/homoserine/homoserine lactone efflux protein
LEIAFLVKGLVVGFSIAAPVGPIGVLCVRRSLAWGRAAGLVSGMGAATADGLYGAVAAFGLTSISAFLLAHQTWFSLVGGVLLLALGARTLLSRPADPGNGAKRESPLEMYGSTFLLTLCNPVTILMFAAIFAGLGIAASARSIGSAALLTGGVFLGSALWWVILSGLVGATRSRFNPASLLWVNRLAGAVIAGFGVAALTRLAA